MEDFGPGDKWAARVLQGALELGFVWNQFDQVLIHAMWILTQEEAHVWHDMIDGCGPNQWCTVLIFHLAWKRLYYRICETLEVLELSFHRIAATDLWPRLQRPSALRIQFHFTSKWRWGQIFRWEDLRRVNKSRLCLWLVVSILLWSMEAWFVEP